MTASEAYNKLMHSNPADYERAIEEENIRAEIGREINGGEFETLNPVADVLQRIAGDRNTSMFGGGQ